MYCPVACTTGAGTGAVMVWEGEVPEVYVPEPVPYCAGTDAISELNISSTYPGYTADFL